MPGNPIAIGPSNIGSFLSVSPSPTQQRSIHGRRIGAPMSFRRASVGTTIWKDKWVCSVSTSSISANLALSATSIDGEPEYDRLLPCSSIKYPPRVEHMVVLEEGHVCAYVSKTLNLPFLYVADLIHFGAVHYALVQPQPPTTATREQIQLYERFTSSNFLQQRQSLKGKTIREAQKTFRITHVDEYVEVGTYLRVYVHPRRFPRCYEIDWRSRIIAVTESYVILDKPAGTSVGGTSNNIEETCANFATRALGLTSPLITTHQIDNCTEGCVVLARTEEFCSIFHGKIRDKMIKKLYLALAVAPMSHGMITHYLHPSGRAPRIISEEYIEGWQTCELEVLDCKKVPWPNSTKNEWYQIQDSGWPKNDFAYECKINLVTGRTHQIRAQFAACGAPLVGDSMYIPAALAEINSHGLDPFGKYRRDYSCEDDERLAIKNWTSLHGSEPSIAIGLQACQISWDNEIHIYEAGSPWWR